MGFFSFKCKNFNTISSNDTFKLAYISALLSYLQNKWYNDYDSNLCLCFFDIS